MQCTKTIQSVMSRDEDGLPLARFQPGSIRKRQTPNRNSLARAGQHTKDKYPTPPSTNIKLQSPSLRNQDPFADYAVYASYADTESPSKVILAEQPADVFESPDVSRQRPTSVAATQFHDAARRLALSTLSPQLQNQSPTRRLQYHTSARDLSPATPNRVSRLGRNSLQDKSMDHRRVTPDERLMQHHRSAKSRMPPPTFHSAHTGNMVRGGLHPQGKTVNGPKSFSRPRRVSQLVITTPGADISTVPSTARHDMETPTVPVNNAQKPTLPSESEPNQSQAANGVHASIAPSPVESTRAEDEVRASFDSAVTESLGDRCLQLKSWEIWMQRILFALLVFVINIALGLAYLGSHKHPYLLAILVFLKSKDILSTFVDILYIIRKKLHDLIWPPKPPKSKWILSLICAYAETEEQIMKTVKSLAASTLFPHKQIVCIILDGKPRDVLAHMTDVKITIQRPYTTWRGKRGEIKVYAGYVNTTPVILVEKVKNAGKKDSLILGHDLFNHPREDMSHATKLLRQELWSRVIPAIITREDLKSVDFIFCTDADSTIHEYALQRLASALLHEKNTIAACGVLFAELGDSWGEYAPWHLFQQFQYTFGQYVRRQAEGSWGRVTCLPGCITMIVVRPEMGEAVSEYARPVTEHNIFRHQVQYLGTDRRLTWCMMSQDKHLRTLFVPEATSETVTPNTLSHYLSQRRRWASNAYFNDYFYALGPQQRLITRLFAVVDLVRLTLVYYRVFNTAYFIHGLITKRFYIAKILPTLVVTKTPALWYLLLIALREPVLRKRIHKLLLGMLINQIISPFLSVLVFTNVIFHMGSQSWGKTGLSTQGTPGATTGLAEPPLSEATLAERPPLQQRTPPKSWTPKSLAKTVKDAIRGSMHKPRTSCTHDDLRMPRNETNTPHVTRSDTQSQREVLPKDGETPTATAQSIATTSGRDGVENTPHPRTVSKSTPMSLTWRSPHRRKRDSTALQPVKETPTKAAGNSNNKFDFGFDEL